MQKETLFTEDEVQERMHALSTENMRLSLLYKALYEKLERTKSHRRYLFDQVARLGDQLFNSGLIDLDQRDKLLDWIASSKPRLTDKEMLEIGRQE